MRSVVVFIYMKGTDSECYRLLQLADASQCCPLLLGGGDASVASVSPQLVVEVLHTVNLSLGPGFALGRGKVEERISSTDLLTTDFIDLSYMPC